MPNAPAVRACAIFLMLMPAPLLAQESAAPAAQPPASAAPPTTPSPPADAPGVEGALANPTGNSWIVRIDPNVWWVSPAGNLRMPTSGASGESIQLSDLNIDTPEATPAGHLDINAENFRFSFFGAAYTRDAGATINESIQVGDLALTTGDEVDTDFELDIYELTVGYRFYTYDWYERSTNKEDATEIAVDLYVLGGARLYNFDINIERADASASTHTEQFFGDLIGGVRAELRFLRDFNINTQVDLGGMTDSDRTSYSFSVQLAGEWRPWPNVGVELGWRHTFYDFEDGEGEGRFAYDGSLAGLFTGIVIRF